jgi:hypothetical protein
VIWHTPPSPPDTRFPTRPLDGDARDLASVSFGDGLLASADADLTVRLWDVKP